MALAKGIYRINNVSTGGYAVLLNNNDRSDVVTLTRGLRDDDDRGYEVRVWVWVMDHLSLKVR